MKAFTFRLEPILTMREGIRKSALGAYAHSIQKCNALEKEISNLKETNKNVLSSNQKLEDKVFTLMARLERLEKVALGDIKSKDLAIYKIK